MAEPNPSSTEVTAVPTAPKTSLLAKLGVFLSVLAVITVECLVAYLFLPSSAETEAMAAAAIKASDTPSAAHTEQKKADKPAAEHEESADLVEVDLGEFTVTASQPSNNSTLRIAFHLFGAVAAIEHSDFESKMKEIQHRYREQVLVTLRGASVNDLTDAGLGLLKRTILEKTNALLGKPLLKMVIFSEFSFYEM